MSKARQPPGGDRSRARRERHQRLVVRASADGEQLRGGEVAIRDEYPWANGRRDPRVAGDRAYRPDDRESRVAERQRVAELGAECRHERRVHDRVVAGAQCEPRACGFRLDLAHEWVGVADCADLREPCPPGAVHGRHRRKGRDPCRARARVLQRVGDRCRRRRQGLPTEERQVAAE